MARYVGESARSGAERMGEHVDDARNHHKDSHMWKHWINQHQGRETKFNFKILSYFSSPLERQVGEAVRIMRTGAEQILYCKNVFSRCKVPRIIANDGREEQTLGETEGDNGIAKEDLEVARADRRKKKMDRLKDLLEWGKI